MHLMAWHALTCFRTDSVQAEHHALALPGVPGRMTIQLDQTLLPIPDIDRGS